MSVHHIKGLLETKNCPFCNNITQSTFFAQSKLFAAIYNIAPILPGHSLVIPKKHIISVTELSETDLAELFTFTRLVTQGLNAYYKVSAFDWSLQDGIAAGQTIPHLHIHIVPRKENDLGKANEWYKLALDSNEAHLDSLHRNRLNSDDYQLITKTLRTHFEQG